MVSCLILYHPTITISTKCMILRSIFLDEDFEIHVISEQTTIIYVWNVEKSLIWQAALSLETTNIMVGYGFGRFKKDAHHQAWEILLTRIKEDKEIETELSSIM